MLGRFDHCNSWALSPEQRQEVARAIGTNSILKTLSLEECIAESTADYVRIAAELASAPERLTQYRSTLRDRLQKSAICDGQRFTRGLETAYRAAMKSAAS